jgi:hypothetical protein
MISRRFLVVISLLTTATSFFLLGVFHTQKQDGLERATYEARLDALRTELRAQVEKATGGDLLAEGTSGVTPRKAGPPAVRKERPLTPRDRMIADIKRELQDEMGLLPVQLLRDRRSSFVELYTTDNFGKTSYGTAGYLGSGYFITVKHAVVALKDEGDHQNTRRVVSIRVSYQGKEVPARLIDAGDADVEVHSGDWAIIRAAKDVDLPPLNLDTSYAYDFADPIFRLGNDYSKGIILSTGYIGQRTANGLVTCLTDGHPGVSGGGVLNQRGDLVGIPIGRMQGDYRFSFILPVREEMLRKVEFPDESEGQIASAAQ